jgi:hypothetical protein
MPITTGTDDSKVTAPAYSITIPTTGDTKDGTTLTDPKGTGLVDDPMAKAGLIDDPMALDKNSNSTGNGTDDGLLGDDGTATIDDGMGGGDDGCNCGGAPLSAPMKGGSKGGSGPGPMAKGGSKGMDSRDPMTKGGSGGKDDFGPVAPVGKGRRLQKDAPMTAPTFDSKDSEGGGKDPYMPGPDTG